MALDMAVTPKDMQLCLGPVLFNWQAEAWRDFYFRIADEAPVDTVVVGEVVCSKRTPFFENHIPDVVERLKTAGKNVLLGSLILISTLRERRLSAALAASEDFTVEVNDLSCLTALAGKPHAIGPFINIYNEASAAFHIGQGANRICLPPELPLSSIAAIVHSLPEIPVEVFAFGRMPLAISARCYHARLHKISKDNCRFVCDQDPDGLTVTTLDGDNFLTINGVQTMSHACSNLLTDAASLSAAGVRSLRLSPQNCDMVEVAKTFRDRLDGRIDATEGTERLAALYPHAPFANGFLHGAPGHTYSA